MGIKSWERRGKNMNVYDKIFVKYFWCKYHYWLKKYGPIRYISKEFGHKKHGTNVLLNK